MRERDVVKDLVCDIMKLLGYQNWLGFIVAAIDKVPDKDIYTIYNRIKEVR